MEEIKLDPDMPERLQLDKIVKVDPYFELYIPELSLIAEQAFNNNKGTWDFKLRGPSVLFSSSPEDKAPDGAVKIDVPENAPPGTEHLKPERLVNPTVPVTTPLMDPRDPPCHGNVEKLAACIGVILAHHVASQTTALEAKVGKVSKHRSEVKIFGKLPLGRQNADASGLDLNKDRPMLKGRVDLIFDR